MSTAAEFALAKVSRVRDDPDARLALLCRLYAGPAGDATTHLPYRRAAVAFVRWQLRRGLLRPLHDPRSGSPWWRAVNERLVRDGWEALALADSYDPAGATASAFPSVEFIREPTARNWYPAHNVSIVAAYLEHRDLAARESRTERFFINLVLLRVLYAHALGSAPRLALGWLAPVAPALGDPRVRMTGIFLSISRILPYTYPLGDDVERYVAIEHRVGRLLDVGVIQPRLRQVYEWSAAELDQPGVRDLLADDVPCYAWPADDRLPWFPRPTVLARMAPAHCHRGYSVIRNDRGEQLSSRRLQATVDATQDPDQRAGGRPRTSVIVDWTNDAQLDAADDPARRGRGGSPGRGRGNRRPRRGSLPEVSPRRGFERPTGLGVRGGQALG